MKHTTGLEAARRILELDRNVKVIILTTFDHDEHVYEALRMGVSGFLLKDAPAHQLVEAIRVAASGDAMLEPSVARRLINDYANRVRTVRQPTQTLAALTDREREVMQQVARGLSNTEISATLFISETTVKSHVSRILTKLQLRDRTQIAVTAHESGLMQQ